MQMRTFTWTNPTALLGGAVARNIDVGFTVAEITTIDTTNGGSFYWCDQMANASFLDVDAGTITTSNGFTPLSQSTAMGPGITGFTNASPGVITVNRNPADFGIVAGDTIKVSAVADDSSTANSLNGTYTVASVTSTTITTGTNTTAYSVYVSGGFAVRTLDSSGKSVALDNVAIRGITAGTGVVGADEAVMVAIVKGKNSVV